MIKTRLGLASPALLALAVLLVFVGAGCSKKLAPPEPITLKVWRSTDATDSLVEVAAAYKQEYSYVDFDFRVLKEEEYEDELLKAWAKGEGPDIFSVPNWRLGKFAEFVSPMPEKVSLKTLRHEKKFGKTETIVEKKTVVMPAPSRLRDQFVETVAQDVVLNGKIYGLPYSVDTMVLYYNRDLLSKAQIAVPPSNWTEFRDEVEALVILDETKNILQAAAALGTTDNVPYFFDLISVMMMQNGAPLATANGNVALGGDREKNPAVDALEFYIKFADPAYSTYTWNNDQLNALEAFTQGNLAFYFGYYRDLETIKKRAPNLNFSYSRMPQIDERNPVDYARYPVESVSVASANPDHAWNFINFAAGAEQVAKFLAKTERVPAVTELIATVQDDPDTGLFAQQALTARSWYHGQEPDLAVGAMSELINGVLAKPDELAELLNIAAAKINLTVQK